MSIYHIYHVLLKVTSSIPQICSPLRTSLDVITLPGNHLQNDLHILRIIQQPSIYSLRLNRNTLHS